MLLPVSLSCGAWHTVGLQQAFDDDDGLAGRAQLRVSREEISKREKCDLGGVPVNCCWPWHLVFTMYAQIVLCFRPIVLYSFSNCGVLSMEAKVLKFAIEKNKILYQEMDTVQYCVPLSNAQQCVRYIIWKLMCCV